MSAGSTVGAGSANASPARAIERVPGKPRAGRKRERRKGEPVRTYVASQPEADARDRGQLLDRLENLRNIVPVFAHELASARRQTAALRLENSRLLERIRELQRKHARRT
jgi:hypothetical protein